jgi:hypothetical protein
MSNDPPALTSPDGMIRVAFDVSTGRMSHEIYSPRVVRLPEGEVLLDLWGTMWDASTHFDAPGTVRLSLRYYPGERHSFEVTVDARARSFHFADSPTEQHALSKFARLIERKYKTQPAYVSARQPAAGDERLVAILVVGLLILGAFYLLALAVGWR